MVEDDPRGLNDPGPPPKRSRIETPSDKPSASFDARSAISATRQRTNSASSSTNESLPDYQLSSRYEKDAVDKKPDLSKFNPFKAKTAAPFKQGTNQQPPQNEPFASASNYNPNQDQQNRFPQSRWNSDQRSESNNFTRYPGSQGSQEAIKREVKVEPEIPRFKVPQAPLPSIDKVNQPQPPPFRAPGDSNIRPPFVARPPFQRPPLGMRFPDVKQEDSKPEYGRGGNVNVPPFRTPFSGSPSPNEGIRPNRPPPFQGSIRPVRPAMSQRPFQPQGARFQISQNRPVFHNSEDQGGTYFGNRASYYRNDVYDQYGSQNDARSGYGGQESAESSLGEGVGVGIKLEPDFLEH